MRIKSLLIANRGEIAVRIVRAARALGIKTIQAYSDADKESLAVRLADDSVRIGESRSALSYLHIENILKVAKEKQADAIHPGYGFLSENADFSDAVAAANIIFVGPSGDTIRALGNKANAISIAQKAGAPTVPGSRGELRDKNHAINIAKNIGYPVMIKAAAGGGGKGIRVAYNEEELIDLFPKAANEARATFGNSALYMEKYIAKARHIEAQIIGDGKNCIHLYERECSLQRRRQKIWEESPAAYLSPACRKELCGSALAIANSVGYSGAVTIEYVYDAEESKFYFIEANTRIQVEHPITEMTTVVDIVQEMIKIAGGLPLSLVQQNIVSRGHAIECRINAEDPSNNFMPSPGVISKISVPQGEGIRFDTFLYEGYKIPIFYDSLVGKLVVWAENRELAIHKMNQALKRLKIEGIKTTIPLHLLLTENERVLRNDTDTMFLESFIHTVYV